MVIFKKLSSQFQRFFSSGDACLYNENGVCLSGVYSLSGCSKPGAVCSVSYDHRLHDKLAPHLDSVWGNIMLRRGEIPKSVLFFAAGAQEGATTSAFHLALFLAKQYAVNTLFIDAALGAKITRNDSDSLAAPGLIEFLNGEAEPEEIALSTDQRGLSVIHAGLAAGSTKELGGNIIFRKEALSRLLDWSRERYDSVVIDSRSIVAWPLGLSLAALADHVVLVCRFAHTRREVCLNVVDQLTEHGIELGGVILNDRRYPIPPHIYRKLK